MDMLIPSHKVKGLGVKEEDMLSLWLCMEYYTTLLICVVNYFSLTVLTVYHSDVICR